MQKFTFPGAQGDDLAARLDMPEGEAKAYALFAHCFTCTKDILAAAAIARALTKNGIAVVRFDFTGLGSSSGEFANTNFTSNVQDLVAAADHMREKLEAPQILIGHSLGGAAVLAAAHHMEEVRAVSTIGAPADARHVSQHFGDKRDEIMEKGEAEVSLAGRKFIIKKQFLEDIEERSLHDCIANLGRALLVMHAPLDEVVGVDNAAEIFKAARHPKSYISLDDADHLLSRREDAEYAAEVIAAWAARYVAGVGDDRKKGEETSNPYKAVAKTTGKGYQQHIVAGTHTLTADEPESAGGYDTGPDPYGLLAASLGACTSMTLQMYAGRKDWPLEGVEVYIGHEKKEEDGEKLDVFSRNIIIKGDDLDEDRRARLIGIANKCPVHRTLEGRVRIETEEKTG